MLRFAEEIMLLLLDDKGGKFADLPAPSVECALAGAVLMDLALEGRIDTDPERLFVVDPTPLKELQPWTRTFPYEFYELIYKLKQWPGPDGHKRPAVIGHYTNDIVYARLAPGVLDELKRRTPRLPSGNRPHKFFQWFTPGLGHPKLKEHLAAVMALMRASPNWDRFMANLNRAFPDKNETIPLPLDD